jgi:hypothetical protein
MSEEIGKLLSDSFGISAWVALQQERIVASIRRAAIEAASQLTFAEQY